MCRIVANALGCWNSGVCASDAIWKPGTEGGCAYIFTPRCAACVAGSCGGLTGSLVRSLIGSLPGNWIATPEIDPRLFEKPRRVRRRLQRTYTFPPDTRLVTSPAVVGEATIRTAERTLGCASGSQLCCGLTGFRCGIPGLLCGKCTEEQKRQYAAMAGLGSTAGL